MLEDAVDGLANQAAELGWVKSEVFMAMASLCLQLILAEQACEDDENRLKAAVRSLRLKGSH